MSKKSSSDEKLQSKSSKPSTEGITSTSGNTKEEDKKKFDYLVAKMVVSYWLDDTFRHELRADPATVLENIGIDVKTIFRTFDIELQETKKVTIFVIDNAVGPENLFVAPFCAKPPDKLYINIPPKPSDAGDDMIEILGQHAGGSSGGNCCTACGTSRCVK